MLRELFTSDDFKRYQLKLANELANAVMACIDQNPQYAKGAVDIAKRAIALPSNLNKDSEAITQAYKEVINRFKVSFLLDE